MTNSSLFVVVNSAVKWLHTELPKADATILNKYMSWMLEMKPKIYFYHINCV